MPGRSHLLVQTKWTQECRVERNMQWVDTPSSQSIHHVSQPLRYTASSEEHLSIYGVQIISKREGGERTDWGCGESGVGCGVGTGR